MINIIMTNYCNDKVLMKYSLNKYEIMKSARA